MNMQVSYKKLFTLLALSTQMVGAAVINADTPTSTPSTLSVDSTLKEPLRMNTEKKKNTNEPVKPEGVSEFAASPFKLNTSTGQIPVETRLRIEVETPLSAAKSMVGQDFEARVMDDFYLAGDFRKLIVPKYSWVRGKVSYVKRPKLLSRSGKLGIKLDSMVTPQGDYVPLDADLIFVAGTVNKDGLLDPQTDFGDKAIVPTQKLWSTDIGKGISVATFGVPIVGSLLGGSIIAVFSHGDSASVTKGQELQIMLTTNTDLAM